MDPDEAEVEVEVTEERLLRVRGALSHRVGALMRAWWLGMVTARDEDEQELYDELVSLVGEPGARRLEGDLTPLAVRLEPPLESGISDESDLSRISDDEYLSVFDQLMTRLELLRQAYDRGMIVASTPEQEQQLARIRELLER
ncbi:MAG: hypothetical protein JST31_17290 [Actinobacteria bacterium]|nr:hypothetical protein [Actinomycetota bacterium]